VETEGVYFITSTIVEWIPALADKDILDMMVRSLGFCRENKGLKLYAYVLLENHFHVIAEAPNLGTVIQSFKRYTAGEIIRLAEASGKEWLINQFAYHKARHKQSSQQQVWQEGFHPQLVQSDAMLRQKIEYIHNNPVRRGYVDVPEHWRYSSARNYILDDYSVLGVDSIL
jgi:REP element-mobilizing transposase RayT